MTPLRVHYDFCYRCDTTFDVTFYCTELKKNGRTYEVHFYGNALPAGKGAIFRATIANSKAFMKAFGDGFRDLYPADEALRCNPRLSGFKKLVRPLVRQVLEDRAMRLERLR